MFTFLAIAFVIGYIAIALEHNIHVDKAASALLTAVIAWTIIVFGADAIFADQAKEIAANAASGHGAGGLSGFITGELRHHLGEIAEILFFLMGAMTIVELIDAHDGFKVITDRITTTSKVKLLWVVCFIGFFLSAVIDNLTATIVMVSLLRKLIADKEDRWMFIGMLIIAANAGGAWSPIGDVTTTMLWIGHQITALNIMKEIILPSLVCMLVPLIILSFTMKGNIERPEKLYKEENHVELPESQRNIVLILGISLLLFVPVFKTVTHLPPYMGMMFGLGVLWVVTEIMHNDMDAEDRHPLTVIGVLRKVDMASVLFFLGILLAVGALATAGHLDLVAGYLRDSLGNIYAINIAIGLLSAVVDNVPLVAGAMKMYPLVSPEQLAAATNQEWLHQFVTDGHFWEFLAYCAGTGGSCLIIGSAAGVAAMGMEKISFMWYLRKVSWLAFVGYIAGAFTYIAMYSGT